MLPPIRVVIALAVLMLGSRLPADDAYYRVPLDQLDLSEGKLPAPDQSTWRNWFQRRSKPAYAILDGEGEIYITYPSDRRGGENATRAEMERELVIRVAQSRDITGRLILPTAEGKAMVQVRFHVPSARAKPSDRGSFYEGKQAYYEDLLNRDVPGAAWFRHEARQARLALGKTPGDPTNPPGPGPFRPRSDQLSDTYAMFTGGRAMSENLQLDRVLRPTEGSDETVDLASIGGITVRQIDWQPLVRDLRPELDPLASKIPADQHAVFFPSFNAAVAMADEMAQQGTSILQLTEPRSTSARTFERYQQQLCLTISGVARLLGPAVAQSVAITGSDPYFRTGTDVAVLFEAADPQALEDLLIAQISLAAATVGSAPPIKGDVDGLAYRGVRSADRRICCYLAKMDRLVVVTNSPYQLQRLVAVVNGKTPSLASLDEYIFFRHRYARNDEAETALLFLSDAAIRRWCGPQWRIATSRRTRDAAVMAEIQAGQIDRLVQGTVESGPIYTDLPVADNGQLSLTAEGVASSTLGSLAFMTPIAEMDLQRVTKAEADAYRQWRDRYQQNWRWAFDPIGLRIGIHKERLAADLTVMPLIWGSDYRSVVSVSQGSEFKPDGGDLHDALAHLILAINTKSETMQRQSNFAHTIAGGLSMDPIGWLGDYVSVYVDDDPFWEELAKVEVDKRDEFLRDQGWRLPIGARAEVSSGLKLTAFLAAVRGFVEQASPGMLNWEALAYKDQPYVRITPTERAIGRSEQVRNVAVYYCASGKSLVITLNEGVLQRSIDRELAAGEAEKAGKEIPAPQRTWLGSNMGLQVDQKLLRMLGGLTRRPYQTAMQLRAWGNLPILNVWRQRYPDKDPVAVHQQLWQMRLTCPGGGEYVWNDQWQTMESTVYGCPAAPKEGPESPPALDSIHYGSFGLTFEEQGLRAKVSLER